MNSSLVFKKTCLVIGVIQALTVPVGMTATLLVDNDSDNAQGCTLRSAIESINSAQNSGACIADGVFGVSDNINFNVSSVSGLASTLDIRRDVAINSFGSSITISSLGNGSVFDIRDSNVSIDGAVITGGSASLDGGGISVRDGSITVRNSSIFANRAGDDGAGIFVRGGALNLIDSTVSANTANDDGAGIYSRESSVSIINSTVASNSAVDDGGGIHVDLISFATITNSTISTNAAGDQGGGISLRFNSSVSITNSTVSNNSSDRTAGGISIQSGTLTSRNNLIAGNTTGSGAIAVSEVFLGAAASLNFSARNLIGDDSKTSSEAFNFTPAASVIVSTSDGNQATRLTSILSPLADNDGPTKTHALPIGSPAIDVVSNNICDLAPVNSLDQRGFLRLGLCDIGAFEFGAEPPPAPEFNPVPMLFLLLLDEDL